MYVMQIQRRKDEHVSPADKKNMNEHHIYYIEKEKYVKFEK